MPDEMPYGSGYRVKSGISKIFRSFYKPVLEVFYFFIRFSGIAFLIREIFARRKVTIIVYHNPGAKIFERHLKYLSKRYNFISVRDLSDAIYKKAWHKLPGYSLLITIDDGWKENYDLLETIVKFNVRPIIFLTSHLLNSNRKFWWTINCNGYSLNRLKSFPNNKRLDKLSELYGFYPEKEFPGNRQVLNLDEIIRMKSSVDFGLHTCFHPVLTNCTYREKVEEIVNCREKVEEITGMKIESFAYPNGNYDNECINILRENGIKISRTLDVGRNSVKTHPLRLKITGVSDNGTINKLVSELTGIPLFFQHLIVGNYFKK